MPDTKPDQSEQSENPETPNASETPEAANRRPNRPPRRRQRQPRRQLAQLLPNAQRLPSVQRAPRRRFPRHVWCNAPSWGAGCPASPSRRFLASWGSASTTASLSKPGRCGKITRACSSTTMASTSPIPMPASSCASRWKSFSSGRVSRNPRAGRRRGKAGRRVRKLPPQRLHRRSNGFRVITLDIAHPTSRAQPRARR